MIDLVLDLVFPPRCAGCGAGGTWFCAACGARAQPASSARCRACGRRVSVAPCPLCAIPAAPDSLVAGYALEGPLREAVHRFKYGDRPQLASPLAALLVAVEPLPPGVLVPVPLHPRRRRRRGYNQAELLAREMARSSGRSLWTGLRRSRDTAAQVGRGGPDRRAALKGAFTVAPEPPGAVILVDDVLTTGATLLAAAEALRLTGVGRVGCLALALG